MDLVECLVPGKIIEIQGDESTGKSMLAMELAKTVGDKNGLVVYIDSDFKLHTKMYGVEESHNLCICQPPSIDGILKLLRPLADLGIVELIIIDSVGSLTSEGDNSKDIQKFLVEMSTLIAKAKATCILINQYRFLNDKITPMYDKIISMYASVRVKTERDENNNFTHTILKNKLQGYGRTFAL